MSTGTLIPVDAMPDKYALDFARVEGRRDAQAGAACLAPLKYHGSDKFTGAWLEGFLSVPVRRRARRLVLRDAWPLDHDHNPSRWLRRHWQGGAL